MSSTEQTPTKAVFDPAKIHILGVSLIKGSLDATDEYLQAPKQPELVKVQQSQVSRINEPEKAFVVRLTIELEGQNNDFQSIGLSSTYVLDFHVRVDNLDDFKQGEQNGVPVIDGLLVSTVMGILYSTARGIILERTKGTFFDGVILPVISPKDLANVEQLSSSESPGKLSGKS